MRRFTHAFIHPSIHSVSGFACLCRYCVVCRITLHPHCPIRRVRRPHIRIDILVDGNFPIVQITPPLPNKMKWIVLSLSVAFLVLLFVFSFSTLFSHPIRPSPFSLPLIQPLHYHSIKSYCQLNIGFRYLISQCKCIHRHSTSCLKFKFNLRERERILRE